MKEPEITALAREYAGEIHYGDNFFENENKRFLAWLTRRYCLVEKENIEKYFQSRNYILTHQDEYAVYIVRESEVEMKLLRCIFPEIGKEVEE